MTRTINLKISDGRTEWVDVARAFAILLVMIEHLNFPPIRPYITVFFMPVFFFLSGITFRADIPLVKFLKKKFLGLVIPYAFFSAALLCIFVGYLLVFDPKSLDLKQLIGLFYGRGSFFKDPAESDLIMRGYMQMWFLPALSVMEVLMYSVIHLCKKFNNRLYIYIYIMLTIGCLYNFFFDLLLPWSIDNAFICIIFMYLGCVTRDKLNVGIKCTKVSIALLSIIGFLITMTCGHFCGVVDICFGDYGNSYLLFLVGGFTGSIMLCGFSILLSEQWQCKLLCKFGRNTLPVYALHLTVYEVIDVIGGMVNIYSVDQGVIEIAKLIVAIVVLIPIANIMNKYFPILVGKRKM